MPNSCESEHGRPHLAAKVMQIMSNNRFVRDSAQYASVLPLELLKFASLKGLSAEAAQELRSLQELYTELVSAGETPWKEPELFLALNALVQSDTSDLFMLETIRFHLDCNLRPPSTWGRRYLRSPILRGKLYRYDGVAPTAMDLRVVRTGGPMLIPVLAELFDDMLEGEIYQNAYMDIIERTYSKFSSSFDMIGRVFPELLQDILSTVNVIALVGDSGPPGFSCRTKYYGGIFINPEYEHGNLLPESIIHEYLHQKLWLWWTFEPIGSHEALAVEIVSPVTGRRRSAGVMLHAYLIYAQCIEFYLWANRRNILEPDEWHDKRLSLLMNRIPALRDGLANVFRTEKDAMRMIDVVDECLQSCMAVNGANSPKASV